MARPKGLAQPSKNNELQGLTYPDRPIEFQRFQALKANPSGPPDTGDRNARHAANMASAETAKGYQNLLDQTNAAPLERQELSAWLDAAARECDPLAACPDLLAALVAHADALDLAGARHA
jgi:hypothetical protein